MSDDSLAKESAAYLKRREEELYAAVTEKTRQETLVLELMRSGADEAAIKAVIAAKAQIERDIPIIGRDLSLSAQSANLSTFLSRMEEALQAEALSNSVILQSVDKSLIDLKLSVEKVLKTYNKLERRVGEIDKRHGRQWQEAMTMLAESKKDRADLRERIDALGTSMISREEHAVLVAAHEELERRVARLERGGNVEPA